MLFKITLKIIYKSFSILKIFLKKLFKLELENKINGLMLYLVLNPSITNYIL